MTHSNDLDHRVIAIGSETTKGKVLHIYGADFDWIVFLTEDQEAHCLFNPGSPAEKLATEEI